MWKATGTTLQRPHCNCTAMLQRQELTQATRQFGTERGENTRNASDVPHFSWQTLADSVSIHNKHHLKYRKERKRKKIVAERNTTNNTFTTVSPELRKGQRIKVDWKPRSINLMKESCRRVQNTKLTMKQCEPKNIEASLTLSCSKAWNDIDDGTSTLLYKFRNSDHRPNQMALATACLWFIGLHSIARRIWTAVFSENWSVKFTGCGVCHSSNTAIETSAIQHWEQVAVGNGLLITDETGGYHWEERVEDVRLWRWTAAAAAVLPNQGHYRCRRRCRCRCHHRSSRPDCRHRHRAPLNYWSCH